MQVFKIGATSVPFYSVGGIRKSNSPCLDCDRREVGCHGKCKEYQEYKEKINEMNDIIYKNKLNTENPRSEISHKYMTNHYYKQKPSKYNT